MDFSRQSDDDLARACAEGVDGAERELLRRYMQAIYWLPVRHFHADEDVQGDFLLFAMETLRERNTFSHFDPDLGTRFTSWFGVVIRNLYFDYLRRHRHDPQFLPLDTEGIALPVEDDEDYTRPPGEERANALLGKMSLKCRALFKLLLANSFFLQPDELRWMAQTSKRPLAEVSRLVASLEEDLRQSDTEIEARHRKLEGAFWWKRNYERQLQHLEKESDITDDERKELLEKTYDKLERRREQHQRLLEELRGGAGLSTAPYRKLAEILNLKEGTLGSHITRCRQAVAKHIIEDERAGGSNG